jgi:hypothetical protein
LRITYLVHDLNDAAVRRRVEMLRVGGAEVRLVGFHRGAPPGPTVAGAPVCNLGQTIDSRFAQRSLRLGHSLLRRRALRRAVAGADVILARNLEMLTLAAAARTAAPHARLVYECLDIHRLMVAPGLVGAGLRRLEQLLMRRSDLLIVSSEAFVSAYFEPRQGLGQHFGLPVLLVENKVFDLDIHPPFRRPPRAPGPPWRIGWYGVIRCRKSFELLSSLARRRPDLVNVRIRGRPSRAVFPDYEHEFGAPSGVAFGGPYDETELDRLNRRVHFTWAVDFFEEGANSNWLLPNRIYSGGRCGAVPIAQATVETGRWLQRRGLGLLLDDPGAQLEAALDRLTPGAYRAMEDAARSAPLESFVAGQLDCERLVGALRGEAA